MANYDSVQAIIDAGITNAECLRNNVAQDDGTDTIQGANWFSFKGVTCVNLYANGNSWIGFGSSTEHLKVNRRDAKMWYLYREEGTLYNYYNFIKIRWSGYSRYNYTTEPYKLTYDVIIFDNGTIMLHMIDIPTSNNDGTYALVATSTYTYIVSSTQPDVTFYNTDVGVYDLAYEVAKVLEPYDRKYLIRSDGALYTVTDGTLAALEQTALNSELFATYGFDDLPFGELLQPLSKFDLLYWQDSQDELPSIKATVMATPHSQAVISNAVDLTHSTITGIENMTADCEGDLIVAVSFDGKQTWKAWNGTEWSTLSEEFTGMNKETLEAITFEQWNLLYQGADSFFIRVSFIDTTQSVTEICADFAN